MKWLNVAGLIFNLFGAGVIAAGVMASRASIDRVMASLYSGPNPAVHVRGGHLAASGWLTLRGMPSWISPGGGG
jgi:hypothetical protein